MADQAHVRERTTIGDESVVGRGASGENNVRIGARVRMQTGAYVTAWSVVEDDVFLAPGVMLTNDPTAGRRPPVASRVRPCRLSCETIIERTPQCRAHAPVHRSVVRSETSMRSGASVPSSRATGARRHSIR